MNASRFRAAVWRLKPPAVGAGQGELPDAELLRRFLEERDETAFEALVARHLPAVWAVGRTLLRDPNDVDDAAQATFLVLVRRAAAVRSRDAVGGWLCRIAWRAANRLRADKRKRADAVPADAVPAAVESGTPFDTTAVVGDEIGRLPEKYRLAVQLCYLAGVPTAEVAVRLGWPRGTLLTRLAWAKRRLRDRLASRGVGLAGLGLAAHGRTGTAALVERTVRAAVALRAGGPAGEWVSEQTTSLTEGVVRAMIGNKLRIGVGVGFLTVALLGLGLGRLTVATADAADGPERKKSAVAGKPTLKGREADEEAGVTRDDAEPAGPGEDLVVRRPAGSFTKEVQPYGKATLTFTGNRLKVTASVNFDGLALTATADADYSLNRESMVYGIITAADVSSPVGGEEAAEIALYASALHDVPFAFRVRVEDDAITVKDIKFGPFGSLLFAELFGGESSEELLLYSGMVGGRYKADPNPTPAAPPPAAKPRKK